MAIEIVDFPIKNGDFPLLCWVNPRVFSHLTSESCHMMGNYLRSVHAPQRKCATPVVNLPLTGEGSFVECLCVLMCNEMGYTPKWQFSQGHIIFLQGFPMFSMMFRFMLPYMFGQTYQLHSAYDSFRWSNGHGYTSSGPAAAAGPAKRRNQGLDEMKQYFLRTRKEQQHVEKNSTAMPTQ